MLRAGLSFECNELHPAPPNHRAPTHQHWPSSSVVPITLNESALELLFPEGTSWAASAQSQQP